MIIFIFVALFFIAFFGIIIGGILAIVKNAREQKKKDLELSFLKNKYKEELEREYAAAMHAQILKS